MKRYLLTFHFAFLSVFNFYSQKDALKKIEDFGSNPGNLKLFLFSPFLKTDDTLRPLVVVLHGCAMNAESAAELTGWNKIAKQEKFYVIYPEQKVLNNSGMCFNWFFDNDNEKDKGECGSFYNMITWMKKNYKVDTSRIFITGMSAGACMTVAMLVNYPDLFKSGAAFATVPYKSADGMLNMVNVKGGKLKKSSADWSAPFPKKNYPALYIWQGDKDPVVNKENAQQTMLQWCGLNSIDTIPDKELINFRGAKDFTRSYYNDAGGKPVVVVNYMKGVKHDYPIDPGPLKNQGGKKGMFSVEKGLHATWQVAIDFGLVKE